MSGAIPGYSENAVELIERYEAIDFAEKHQALLRLMPRRPSRVLDVGAGAGGDAAWLAQQGHHVVAVEPTAEFRDYGRRRYSTAAIEWIDDRLPSLTRVTRRGEFFDLILMSAVWMHLDASERTAAMPIVASLLAPAGILCMSLRHGPVPEGRIMFEVTPEEVIAAARASGLEPVANVATASVSKVNREAGVTWTQLAFVR